MASFLNWLLDSTLWRQFFPEAHKPPLLQLLRINIATSSFGFFTPFQMGEYVGKSMYFKELSKKRNYAITFFFRTAKVYVKLFLGGLGFFLMGFQLQSPFWLMGLILIATAAVAFGYIFQDKATRTRNYLKRWIKNAAVQKSLEVRTPRFRSKTLLLATSRILLNALQFLAIIYFVMPGISAFTLFPQVLIFYSIATFVPSVGFLDPLIKSAISLLIVSGTNNLALEVVFATNFVWLFNVGLPALAGSFLHAFRIKPS